MIRVPMFALFAMLPMIGSAADSPRHLYALESKPPAILVIDDSSGVQSAPVPLENPSTHLIVDRAEKFAYVIQQTKKADDLAVVDLKSGSIVHRIDVGINATEFFWSPDRSKLYCFSTGRVSWSAGSARSALKTTGKSARKKSKALSSEESARVTVIDASSAVVIATYRLDGQAGREVFLSPDGGNIFLLSEGFAQAGMHDGAAADQSMAVFKSGQSEPFSHLDLGMNVHAYAFSPNGNLLIAAGLKSSGKEKGQEVLDIVDVASGKIARTEDLGKHGGLIRLVRLQGNRGFVLADGQGLRVYSLDGVADDKNISFAGTGVPEDITLLPDGDRLATLIYKNGAFEHKLAIANLKTRSIDQVLPVGRASERRNKEARGFLKELGAAAILGAVGGALSVPAGAPVILPGPGPTVHNLSTSVAFGAGETLWELDSSSSDVTVFNLSNPSDPPRFVPVGGSVSTLVATDDGSRVFCIGEKDVDVIEVKSAAKSESERLPGKLIRIETDARAGELRILRDSSIDVWDTASGKEKFSVRDVKHLLALATAN